MHKANAKPAIAVGLAIIASVLIGACATQTPAAPDQEQPMTVEEILASAPTPQGRTVSCLWRAAVSEVEVVNPDLLLFHGGRDLVWLNRLRQSCSGLHRGHALAFEMRGDRLCELDTVSDTGPFDEPLWPVGARCSLGKFEPVSPEQARLLKTGLARR